MTRLRSKYRFLDGIFWALSIEGYIMLGAPPMTRRLYLHDVMTLGRDEARRAWGIK